METVDDFLREKGHKNASYSSLFHMLDLLVSRLKGVSGDRIATLERRIAALEAQPRGLQYRGVFELGQTYEKGDVTTHQGSMGVATDRTGLRPDHDGDSRAWVLAVKRGKDGRDR